MQHAWVFVRLIIEDVKAVSKLIVWNIWFIHVEDPYILDLLSILVLNYLFLTGRRLPELNLAEYFVANSISCNTRHWSSNWRLHSMTSHRWLLLGSRHCASLSCLIALFLTHKVLINCSDILLIQILIRFLFQWNGYVILLNDRHFDWLDIIRGSVPSWSDQATLIRIIDYSIISCSEHFELACLENLILWGAIRAKWRLSASISLGWSHEGVLLDLPFGLLRLTRTINLLYSPFRSLVEIAWLRT